MGNEYTVTCPYHGNVIYEGPSESQYNYYRNRYTKCTQCYEEEAKAAREAAQRRAEQRAREERDRVRRRAQELERLEKARQEERERQRAAEREAERIRIAALREQQENERQRLRKEMLSKSTDEINAKARNMKKNNKKRKAKNPFLAYEQLETLKTIQEIKAKVNEVAVVGKVVKDRVNAISVDLEESLGDDYDIIKPEMNRYKKYGEEMMNMTSVFQTEFKNVFDDVADEDLTEMTKLHNKSQTGNNENLKKKLNELVQEKLVKLNGAIKNVEAKLFLMEQYYDQMIIDYQQYLRFIGIKQDELSAILSLTGLANLLENDGDREVFAGNANEKQQLSFTEEYEEKTASTVKSGVELTEAIATGAFIGAAGGAMVGGGALGGAVVGCVIGAAAGAIYGLLNPPEYKVETTTNTGQVTYTAPDSYLVKYSASKQAEELRKIEENIKGSVAYKRMEDALKENRKKASQDLYQAKRMRDEVENIGGKIRDYKLQMQELTYKFESGQGTVSDTEASLIDMRLQELSAEIKVMVQTMK